MVSATLRADEQDLYDTAEADFRAGNVEAAEAAYQALVMAGVDHVHAYIGAARCARLRADHAAAVSYLAAGIAALPLDLWPRLEMALDLIALDRAEAAAAAYRAVLMIAPDCAAAHRGLGQLARRDGSAARALAHFQDAVAAAPADAWSSFDAATELQQLGRLDEARAVLQRLLALVPGDAMAQLGLGQIARRAADRGAAIRHFEAATTAAPGELWPRLELGIELLAADRHDEAEQLYRDILALTPDCAAAHRGLGQVARQRGAPDLALAHFRNAVAAAPADPWASFDAAAALRDADRLQEAEATLLALLAVAPDCYQAHLGLGLCARASAGAAASQPFFQAATAAAPDELWPWLELALDHLALDQIEAAARIYRDLLARLPDCLPAHRGLGDCARRRGEPALALRHFEDAVQLAPDDADAWLDIAALQRDDGAFEQAAATATQVLQRQPRNLNAMLSLGFTAQLAGRHEAALAAFQSAAAAAPRNADVLVQVAVQLRALGRQAESDAALAAALVMAPLNPAAIMLSAERAMIAADHAAALNIYTAASLAQPTRLPFRLGIVEALAAAGRIQAALRAAAEVEADFGRQPAVIAKTVTLLQQAGQYQAALDLIRRGAEDYPADFQLAVERVRGELLRGTDQELWQSLQQIRPGNAQQRALFRRLAGNVAEALWRLDEAMAHYAAAAALAPADPWVLHDLARVQVVTLDIAAAQQTLRRYGELTAYVTRQQGHSLNLSQSHYGQIIDDYRLDAGLLAELSGLQNLPAPTRAGALHRTLLRNPESSAAAISLLVALRQAGGLDRPRRQVAFALDESAPDVVPPDVVAPDVIPRVLVQYWDAPEPPEEIADLMQTWRALNTSYQLIVFNDDAAAAFLRDGLPAAVAAAYRRASTAAQKADIFRLAYLALRGGVYADADDRCLAPLTRIIPADADLVLYQEDHGTLANNFIAVKPGHPVILAALREAVNALNRGDNDYVWLSTGPALLTRVFARHLSPTPDGAPLLPPGSVILDRRALFAAVAIHCAAGYKKTRKHWSNAAFARRTTRADPAPA